MSFITLILVISILVFVHELGHFLVAKKSGVRVDEFAIGFPPRIYGKKFGETTYAINLIPFGGYVKIFGENPDEDSMNGPDKKRSFINKPRHIQAAILVAGIVMNIVFAWILLSMSFMIGAPQASNVSSGNYVFVTDVIKDSPAEAVGLKSGDLITDITSSQKTAATTTNAKISAEKIKEVVTESKGLPVVLTYIRGADKATTSVMAKATPNGGYVIGVQMADIENMKLGFFEALLEGAKATYHMFNATMVGTLKFFGNAFVLHANLQDVSGPIGIAGYLNQAREFGASTLFSFIAVISLNLAVINLLPFPALDGGRLLFVAIEAIIRRPIKPAVANTLNLIGFGLLMLLMLTVTVSDISKLF
ncbi:MAG: rane-associated zinc metalloprotease [Candidatus Taylorbacteria bacterium]|nr:rane-associated zinc metalloprotease [Candidatus Taylorbacteria bacterium]